MTSSDGMGQATYRRAGVDQHAADALVPVYAKQAARTRRLEVVSDLGGFAGLFSLETLQERGYHRPALATSTDTVGTKIELLRQAGMHRTAGWDAVAMNADDIVCSGAEPLLFVDCLMVDRLDPEVAGEIVAGVADGCVEAGCALVGGETAQLPGLLQPDAYEVMGTCVGVVDLDRVWGPQRVRSGDAVVGLASTGPHSNGFALIRRLLEDTGGEAPPDLLAPTAIYARRLLAAASRVEVRAAAHVTGGGIVSNLRRAVPEPLGAVLDASRWPCPPVFDWIAEQGVTAEEMSSVFNLGLGMLVVSPDGDRLASELQKHGVDAWVVGEVTAGPDIRVTAR